MLGGGHRRIPYGLVMAIIVRLSLVFTKTQGKWDPYLLRIDLGQRINNRILFL
jgi:hypothetical protein